jgi:hypothetical protein
MFDFREVVKTFINHFLFYFGYSLLVTRYLCASSELRITSNQ